MGHGGARKGAGKPKGAPNKLDAEARKKALESGLTPLEYMLYILRNEELSLEDRMDAAKAAAPYVHAKLASVEHKGDGGGPMVLEIVRFADKAS